jgi:hypothetical protein
MHEWQRARSDIVFGRGDVDTDRIRPAAGAGSMICLRSNGDRIRVQNFDVRPLHLIGFDGESKVLIVKNGEVKEVLELCGCTYDQSLAMRAIDDDEVDDIGERDIGKKPSQAEPLRIQNLDGERFLYLLGDAALDDMTLAPGAVVRITATGFGATYNETYVSRVKAIRAGVP